MYQLGTASQIYGDEKYLDHVLRGETTDLDRRLVGDRIPSYGVINFGSINANLTKRFKPFDRGIKSDILLRSFYVFTPDASKDETRFSLSLETTKIAEWLFSPDKMPFRFPEGAIINPAITLEVKPKNNVSQVLLYWQPVHVLSYIEV